jgi:enoyl-CoA hydratase/carnithine racemase
MSNYQSILVDRDEHVGIVTLNRPNELNALNFQLVSELANALEELDRDEEIRCMVITGVQVTAQEMADHGLVNRVVPKGEHLREAVKLAKEVAARGPIAVRLAKQAVLASFETTLEEGLEMERKNFYLLFATEDMREGMRAFIEKRKADFKGR